MDCLKMNFSSDKKLPTVSHYASTQRSTGLGSGTWITYTDGSAIQHLHYLPFGEEQIDQRLTNFNSRYTFSAKEKDIETGYSYFGARYYTSDLSIWLSVDPMCDKYPNLTPYSYCRNNPIMLIDPNGEDDYWIDEGGKINLYKNTNAKRDRIFMGKIEHNENGEITNKYVSLDKEKAKDKTFTKSTGSVTVKGESFDYEKYDFANPSHAEKVYNFITKENHAKVEWGLNIINTENGIKSFLTTGGNPIVEPGSNAIFNWFIDNKGSAFMDWEKSNHNHPSGNIKPSSNDIDMANKVRTYSPSAKFTLDPNGKKPVKY